MDFPEPSVFRLENGLQVVASSLPDAPTIAVCACIRAGPVYETFANNGVSHLLEHLHLSTTRTCPTRAEFLESARRLAIELNAQTEPDLITIRFSVAPEQFERGLIFLHEILETRPFPADVVASESVMCLWAHVSLAQRDTLLTKFLAEISRLRQPNAETRNALAQMLAGWRLGWSEALRLPEQVAYSDARELAHAEHEAATFPGQAVAQMQAVTAEDLAAFVSARCRLDRFFAWTSGRMRPLDGWRLRRMVRRCFLDGCAPA
jgi:hypothetical protein